MNAQSVVMAEQEAGAVVALPESQEQSILEVISRAARDPSVDIEKMDRLLQMHERVEAKRAEVAFNVAMNEAQKEMRPIAANASNRQTSSRYATYDKLDRVLRPIYTEHGFALSFDEGETEKPDHVRVLCHVSHIDGHTRIYHRDMPADGKGAKGGDVMTKTHAAGAAGSYGARYLLKGIFNIAVGEEDDDGNLGASKMPASEMISDADIVKINQLAKAVGGNQVSLILKGYNVSDLPELTAKKAAAVINRLEEKLAERVKAETNAKGAK